ncbi:squalene synthase Erg9p [Monosporozyma unispora]|nr:terpene cyclase [Kazachstania unispora]
MSKYLQLFLHPQELASVIQLKIIRKPLFTVNDTITTEELQECYKLLNLTSRSFAVVIMELHPELRNAIMLFYLILRALDTVEDDMTIDEKIKIPLLRGFHEKLLLKDWSFNGNGPNEKDRDVLVKFSCILHEYHHLKPEYQSVISEITEKMGNGMADYIEDEQFQKDGIQTLKDYDLYCHYVAGLVGDGLTQLIVLAEFGSHHLLDDSQLYESMGLFLQKTNIIRDYFEDLEDGRHFWPKEVWSQYGKTLDSFIKDETAGVHCINHLVLNAMEHIEDVMTYLSSISEQSSFQFCAIPQVMAIATLAEVMNNPKVLRQNVKIRKSTTCSLILKSRTFKGCVEIFQTYLRQMRHKLPVGDPNYLKFNLRCGKIDQFFEEMYQENLPTGIKPRETPIYLKVQERSQWDEKIETTVLKPERLSMQRITVSSIALLLSVLIFFST